MTWAEGEGDESPLVRKGSDWVLKVAIDEFIERVRFIRELPLPAKALELLYVFATKRPSADLIACADLLTTGDGRLDAVNLMATAALHRPFDQAADLTIQLWDREGTGQSSDRPLTDSVIHDLARQRTAADVARFIKALARPGLVEKTIAVYVANRTNLDKALLYVALRGEGCRDQAAVLLDKTLWSEDAAAPRHPAAGPAALHDLVGALHDLSPAERILEQWIEEAVADPEIQSKAIELVSKLISANPQSASHLIDYVSQDWSPTNITRLCHNLLDREERSAFGLVRARAAASPASERLAVLVKSWWEKKELRETTEDLVANVVAAGPTGPGPRPLADVENIARWLSSDAEFPPQCLKMLRLVAASHVTGRNGADLVTLLHRIGNRRDVRRAALRVARSLRRHALSGDVTPSLIVEYLKGLHESGGRDDREVASWVIRMLSEPWGAGDRADGQSAAPGVPGAHRLAELIAEVGAGLYDENLRAAGWELLERWLENEQRIDPGDVALVFGRMARSAMGDDISILVPATVGRWTDVHGRTATLDALRSAGLAAGADLIPAGH